MKITFLGTLPPLKSNSYYCAQLACALSEHIQVDFISFKSLYPNTLYPGGNADPDHHFKISENQNLRVRRLLTYYNPVTWVRTVLAIKTQIVHSMWWSVPTAPILILLFFLLKLKRVHIVLTIHNIVPHEQSAFDVVLTKLVFHFPTFFVVHGFANKEKLQHTFGIEAHRIFVIPMGVHDMYVSQPLEKTVARGLLHLESDHVVLFFGNIRDYKGVDVLIESIATVRDTISDVVLIIAGQPWHSFEKYASMIRRLHLENHVRVVARYIPHSDVKVFFAAADLVTLPYKEFDAQSGVGNIALAFQKPLLVTEVGCLPELVKDQVCVVKPANAEELARSICAILKDKSLQSKLSRDSGELARQFSWSNIADKTIRLYKKLAEPREG